MHPADWLGDHSCPTVLTWIPVDVAAAASGESDPTLALAAVAARLGVSGAFVPATASWAVEAANRLEAAGLVPIWAVDGPFGRVAATRGWDVAIRQSAAEPGELAYALAEALHDALDEARAGIAAGVRAMVIADDLAGATGWLVSPDFAIEVLVPLYRRIVAEVEPAGVHALFHSDGNVTALLRPLAQVGFSAVHAGGADAAAVIALTDTARREGLRVLGGIRARDGATIGPESLQALALHARDGAVVIADDGGITSVAEVEALGDALAASRRTCQHLTRKGGPS